MKPLTAQHREAGETFIDNYLYPNRAPNFGTRLYSLIMHADLSNREKIKLGFPEYVEVFERFKEIGLKKLKQEISSL